MSHPKESIVKSFKVIFALLAALVLASCVVPTSHKPSTPVAGQYGQIHLGVGGKANYEGATTRSVAGIRPSDLDSAPKAVARSIGGGAADFDLGNIGVTQQYFFFVQNTGSTQVTNLQISVTGHKYASDPTNDSSPATVVDTAAQDDLPATVVQGDIGSLGPASSTGFGSILQLWVLHGKGAGVNAGDAAASPQGLNEIDVTISYTDQNGNNPQTAVATMSYFIQSWSLDIGVTDTLAEGGPSTTVLHPNNIIGVTGASIDAFGVSYPPQPIYGTWETAVPPQTVDDSHNIQLSFKNNGNVPVTLTANMSLGLDSLTGLFYYVPFSFTVDAHSTLSGDDFDTKFVAAVSHAPLVPPGSSAPAQATVFPFSYWDSVLHPLPVSGFHGAVFSVSAGLHGGVVPSPDAASVYTRDQHGNYALALAR